MAFRMQLTYYEVENILIVKYIEAKSIGYTSPPGIF